MKDFNFERKYFMKQFVVIGLTLIKVLLVLKYIPNISVRTVAKSVDGGKHYSDD